MLGAECAYDPSSSSESEANDAVDESLQECGTGTDNKKTEKDKDYSEELSTEALGSFMPLPRQVTVPISSWKASAKAFADLLVSMQMVDNVGGRGWMQGMQQLLTDVGSDEWGLGDFAGRLMRNQCLAWSSKHSWAEHFKRLSGRLEVKVRIATRFMNPEYDWSLRPEMYGTKCQQLLMKEGIPVKEAYLGWGFRSTLFVGLPLCMYVSDCCHLYILVRRLRSLRTLAARSPLTPESIRTVLDADGKPYSVLMYAIIAALQVLHSARIPLKGKQGVASLETLCASAIPNVRGMGQFGVSVASDHFNAESKHPFYESKLQHRPGSVSGSNALIFRGIWVAKEIDEDSVTHSWSLNSFSRSLEGALWVLDFYATNANDTATRALAQEHAHVLIYVSRYYTAKPELVFPVQFFSSGDASDIEKEVLVPPFVKYVWETGPDPDDAWIDISSFHSRAKRAERIGDVQRRWGMNFINDSPLLIQLLEQTSDRDFISGIKGQLNVTVRFISRIEPAESIQQIFGEPNQPPENILLAFPPDGDVGRDRRFEALDRHDGFGDLLYEDAEKRGTL